jgi:hypothetical protein
MKPRGPVAFHAVQLARNLLAGVRLAFFLPVRALEFRASALQFALLVLLNFALWIGAGAASYGFEGAPDFSALSVFLSSVLLSLATALLVVLAYGKPGHLVLVAIALSASDCIFELVAAALPGVAAATGHARVLYTLFLAWGWLISLRAALLCGGWRRPQVYQAALAVTAMMAIGFFVLPRVEPWLPPEEEEAVRPGLADERLFHLQGELIERALAGVHAGRHGVAEIYFVGFAPDASQKVFLHELRYVKKLFDERFDAAGHSIALASSQDALDELPIGSVTNLGRALARVGQAMNPDEDILFLYISAHGDRAHRLSASQPPLELASLTPTSLARMLQRSGVRWRVIVVSACYSGGYIEPLRDDNTVVITAAAADRASFGCEEGRDFTYFGEAYFRDSLARTRSFTSAFTVARQIVSRREAREHRQPSLPQMWVGRSIAERLKRLPE